MNWRTTLALLVLVAGLGWYGLRNRYFVPGEEKPLWPHEEILKDINRDAIQRVEILGKHGKIALEHRAPPARVPWQMVEPIDFPASLEELNNLKDKLFRAKIQSDVKSGDPKELGLEPAAKYVRFTGPSVDRRLKIGNKTSWSGGYFAQIEGSDRIVTLESEVVEQIDKTVDDYRFKSIFDFPAGQAVAAEFQTPEQTIRCEKTADGWRVTSPHRMAGGTTEIESYLSYLSHLRISRYVKDKPADKDLAEFGLAEPKHPPQWKVTVSFPEGSPWVFKMGKNVSGSAEYHYAWSSNWPDLVGTVFVRKDEVVKTLDAFHSDSMFPVPHADWAAVRLERPQGPVALRMEGKRWQFDGDVPTNRTDELAAQKWIHQISELRFREFARQRKDQEKDNKDLKDEDRFRPVVEATSSAKRKLGFTDPQPPALSVTYKTGKTERLVFGKATDQAIPVMKDGEEVIVWLKKEAEEVLKAEYLELRDRQLTDLWADGAIRIQLSYRSGSKLTFHRNDANQWIEENDAGKRDYPAARELVRKLARLQAEKFLAVGGADWAQFGLDHPEATVQVLYRASTAGEPERTCTLAIGSLVADETRYSRLEEDPSAHLFTISRKLADMVLKELPTPAVPEQAAPPE